jgi:type I restriction enzyme, R subunit
MDNKEKRKLSESDICDLFITPAIKEAGWDPIRQIRREVTLTPGPIIVRGNMSSRNKMKKHCKKTPNKTFLKTQSAL